MARNYVAATSYHSLYNYLSMLWKFICIFLKNVSQNWVHQNTLPLSDKSTSPGEGVILLIVTTKSEKQPFSPPLDFGFSG